MAIAAATHSTQFSFDHMASEVSAIVEDLRWLHLELTLRNRCAEALLLDSSKEEDVLRHAFAGLRDKIGALELAVFLSERSGFRRGFHDIEEGIPWAEDNVPWTSMATRCFSRPSREFYGTALEVGHYTVNAAPVTAISAVVSVSREVPASILVLFPSTANVPRLKKFLAGIASSLGLSLDHLRKSAPASGRSPERGSIPGDAAAAESDELEVTRGILDLLGFFCALFDRNKRPIFVNKAMRSALWKQVEPDAPVSFLEEAFRASDRDGLYAMLDSVYALPSGNHRSATFPIRLADGTFLDASWTFCRLDANADEDNLFLLAGAPTQPPRSESGTQPRGADDDKAHFRLSKQYRFMLKYLPFPVAHLDETSDVIRNANPAFEEVAGTSSWEGAPLSDIASLTVLPSIGDAKPCTLSVITSNGITLTYRGMITTLVLFGKTVREVKLDPLESARRPAAQ